MHSRKDKRKEHWRFYTSRPKLQALLLSRYSSTKSIRKRNFIKNNMKIKTSSISRSIFCVSLSILWIIIHIVCSEFFKKANFKCVKWLLTITKYLYSKTRWWVKIYAFLSLYTSSLLENCTHSIDDLYFHTFYPFTLEYPS